MRLRLIGAITCAAFLVSCATQPRPSNMAEKEAAKNLAPARSTSKPPEERAALYLQAAATAAPNLGSGTDLTGARETYNQAAAELTVLLRSEPSGRLWNHQLTLTGGNKTYHLHLQPAGPAVWAPDYFTSLELASSAKEKLVRKPNLVEGVGGELVGVRKAVPREPLTPAVGISAPVTATLDFHGQDATLALRRPAKEPRALVQGKVRPLAANYSAPILHYPHVNETLTGLMGALFVTKYIDKTGLYLLQPYDPSRIPVVFVHGLISTAQMWINVINELNQDPVVRARYQFWVFAYPTGVPVLYSSLRLREELEKVQRLYPDHKGYVLVGHSMGGLLAQAQTSSVTRADWEKTIGAPAKQMFSKLQPGDLVTRSMTFRANPQIKRLVFICTPHRGSAMATGGLGRLAIRLISLPAKLVNVVTTEVGHETLKQIAGGRVPNSVNNLEPKSPYLKILNNTPIQAPYHSIIGNGGKPGPLADSTDGVVPYWSSHLDNARSELIVPGPHGSCELPETIAELRRILRLHLEQ